MDTFTLWFSGLSGAGKTTISNELKNTYFKNCVILDGDVLRNGLCKDLGFSDLDRTENVRRAGEVARLLNINGISVIASFITPFEDDRKMLRDIVGDAFKLCWVKCSLETCEHRDVKGLYKKVRDGKLQKFTGISSAFEEPKKYDICVDTENMSLGECVRHITWTMGF